MINTNKTSFISQTQREKIKENFKKYDKQANENIDDLQFEEMKLVQYKDWYSFNSDSVLLANVVNTKPNAQVAELGAGSGVISLLICAKNKVKSISAVELQPRAFALLSKNIILNEMSEIITPVLCSMQECHKTIGAGAFDIVVTNPPYSKVTGEMISGNTEIAIARHEVAVNLKEVIQSSARLLKNGGKLYIIYKASRLIELIENMLSCRLAPKQIINIIPTQSKETDTVIVVAAKDGKIDGLTVDNLICYDNCGEMTETAKKLYNKI